MDRSLPVAGYETTFITRPDMSDDTLKTLQDRLIAVLPQFQGELIQAEDWGRKKLAYPINNESRARYTHLVYTGRGNVVAEVERNLKLSEHVLRYLTVQVEKEFNVDTFKKYREDVKASIKKRAEEREARREEKRAMAASEE